MMTNKSPPQLSGLAGRLVADGLLDAETARTAQTEAAREKTPFVTYLVAQDYLEGQKLAEMAAISAATRRVIRLRLILRNSGTTA